MWQVELRADAEQIARFRAQAPAEHLGIRFTESGDVWLLESDAICAATDAKSAIDAGNLLVDQLNFAASLSRPGHKAVRQASAVIDEYGRRSAFVTAQTAVVIAIAGTATISTGTPPTSRPRTVAELIADLGPIVPAIERVRVAWERDRSPVGLYKIFEIIRDQAGKGPCGPVNLVGAREVSRFTSSANHPEATGELARHAVSRDHPPKDPMTAVEMSLFIADVIRRWLRCLAVQHQIPLEAPA
ncbi:MAG: hypothetical protein KDB21_10170 [Acidimicrobiales bacterium]|nr:hypothetical protein [Acidimicrobiales bacterium]